MFISLFEGGRCIEYNLYLNTVEKSWQEIQLTTQSFCSIIEIPSMCNAYELLPIPIAHPQCQYLQSPPSTHGAFSHSSPSLAHQLSACLKGLRSPQLHACCMTDAFNVLEIAQLPTLQELWVLSTLPHGFSQAEHHQFCVRWLTFYSTTIRRYYELHLIDMHFVVEMDFAHNALHTKF